MFPIKIDIVPVPKPRMTQSDRWRSRPCTDRYWEFKDRLVNAWEDRKLPEQLELIFTIPMPTSWSQKKRDLFNGKPHQNKPDIDNLQKAVLDCLAPSDAYIWHVDASKFWGTIGSIEINNLNKS
jgi:Holliday junction resolvase RusA-like endonuclease